MTRSLLAVLLAALVLSGCGLFRDTTEAQRRNWQVADWYRAAKEELDNGNWQAATKLYSELESKFPYGRYAQQAQLDSAYAFYREGETAQAVSALDRFMKAYPNHPVITTRSTSRRSPTFAKTWARSPPSSPARILPTGTPRRRANPLRSSRTW